MADRLSPVSHLSCRYGEARRAPWLWGSNHADFIVAISPKPVILMGNERNYFDALVVGYWSASPFQGSRLQYRGCGKLKEWARAPRLPADSEPQQVLSQAFLSHNYF